MCRPIVPLDVLVPDVPRAAAFEAQAERLAARIAHHNFLADQVRGLQMLHIRELLRQVLLQNNFVRVGRRKEMPLHAFERVIPGRRSRQARDLRQVPSRPQPQVAGKAKFGIDLDHVRKVRQFLAGGFVER